MLASAIELSDPRIPQVPCICLAAPGTWHKHQDTYGHLLHILWNKTKYYLMRNPLHFSLILAIYKACKMQSRWMKYKNITRINTVLLLHFTKTWTILNALKQTIQNQTFTDNQFKSCFCKAKCYWHKSPRDRWLNIINEDCLVSFYITPSSIFYATALTKSRLSSYMTISHNRTLKLKHLGNVQNLLQAVISLSQLNIIIIYIILKWINNFVFHSCDWLNSPELFFKQKCKTQLISMPISKNKP